MSLFGASVYLHLATKEELSNYLELLGKNDIKLIFTTLISFKKEQAQNWEKLAMVAKIAEKYQMRIIADINGELLKDLDLTYKKPKELIAFFQSKGLSGIRIAAGISLDWQAKLTHNNSDFKVIINGSHNLINLEQLILGHRINNSNVISCYNFYPQRYTGASVDFYLINQYESHINNILFAGFVSLQGKDYHGPWEFDNNLPSLEIHRDWDLLTQVHHLIALGTDIILISNQFATEKDLRALKEIDQEKVTLVVELESDASAIEKTILFDEQVHFVRPDLAQDMIISSGSRISDQAETISARDIKQEYFAVGDVVILNQKAKNYAGELQIITKKIKNDGIRNLVAKIKEPYLSYFLPELKATRPFKFVLFAEKIVKK